MEFVGNVVVGTQCARDVVVSLGAVVALIVTIYGAIGVVVRPASPANAGV